MKQKIYYCKKNPSFMSFVAAFGFTIKVIGEMFLAISVYSVHNRVAKEGRIDKHIIKQIHKEKYLALVALALIIFGYLLELPSRLA